RFARYNDLRFKAAAARDHGAKALLLIAREEKFQDDKLSKLVFDNANTGDAGLPVVVISRQLARRVLEPLANATVTLELSESPGADKEAKRAEAQTTPVTSQGNTALLDRIAFSINTDIVRRETQAYNVVGILEGSDPKLKEEAIVIGAHYDHLGRGGQGSLAGREGGIHYGADDNASGVAALLELARRFSSAPVKPRRAVIFIAFGGEEEGLLGSKYYVEHPIVPLAQTVAMINLDMVGRMKDDKLVIGGVGTAAEWRELIAQANSDLKIKVAAAGKPEGNGAAHGDGAISVVRGSNGATVATLTDKRRFNLTLNEDGFGPSDHSSFYAKKTPVLFLFTGTHEDYHKPSDTAERINYEGLSRIVGFVGDLVGGIDHNDKRPTYALAKSSGQMGRAIGFRVYLGTIPSYAEGNAGLKLDGVREGSPAEKAGLKAGDVVVKLAGRKVRNVYDYTYLLGELKPDQEYEVEALRGGERLTLKLTPTARK
ncbi:MAG: M20/M25/M40 family metallo-hydrolase, partial [Acidobacteriota bacterium]|nr:M20/M25/M40 family metallo-hydrolase [Acidobacteriota bacterium]